MNSFDQSFKQLNQAQQAAVRAIDGPLLVLAGPGTGKTQLLGMRVANILLKTDTLPENILCLTFTESGASNMRERLTRFIGQAAYDVQIGTYHEFGGGLIKRFSEYFTESRLERPVDELGKHQIVETIVAGMSYLNPLKQTEYHLSDLISTISEIKRALLSGDDLRAIAAENHAFIVMGSTMTGELFADFSRMPGKLDKAMPLFSELASRLNTLVPDEPVNRHFAPLATLACQALDEAMREAEAIGKTTPLTKWKNDWLAKNNENQFVITGELTNRRLHALADVMEQYQDALEKSGYYDFDDMILRAIHALETNDDLRLTLQERYQYLLLDEFQDTNAAQFRLVELLTDNPVHEGRPNVMAVGDDDQAIYAFQGANYSNMLDFFNAYRGVQVINLKENYRSHGEVLQTAHAVATQIDARLHHHFPGLEKELVASNPKFGGQALISRDEFVSDIAQYDWIAEQIEQLIRQGTRPAEIAVLAPKHKYLEPLVAHLNERTIPVSYEKRENILQAPVIRQLVGMSRLVLALRDNNTQIANSLWPEVLSYDFWQIPVRDIWEISWKVSDSRGSLSWSQELLEQARFQQPALLLLTLAAQADELSLEMMLDYLSGTAELITNDERLPTASSPLRDYLLSPDLSDLAGGSLKEPELFYHTLSHLTVLRAKLREHQEASDRPLVLRDLIHFIGLYERAGQQMLNTSPYNQHADAVQLMTVFRSKGLEFEHVFLPSLHDDVWGETSRGNSNRLTLPANMAPVRPGATTPDERLRIFFVAITRAKLGLHFTSFTGTFSGKTNRRLKYMNELEQPDGSHASLILPEHVRTIHTHDEKPIALDHLELNWRTKHLDHHGAVTIRDLLAERLDAYQLSPTHLTKFTDLQYGGPEDFFFSVLLRFPSAPTADSIYGTAIHEAIEWLQKQLNGGSAMPTPEQLAQHFRDHLKERHLTPHVLEQLSERGSHALTTYLPARAASFRPGDKAEVNFKHEGVFIGPAHLGGKVDLLRIDQKAKKITVVDYKTGASYARWKSDTKLHKYRQQLYAYKLLVEGSHTYRGYTVDKGLLEFVDPDNEGAINTLELTCDPKEVERTRLLIRAMWQHVKRLELPDVSLYNSNLSDIIKFEDWLISTLEE
ncbi:ATP-dependent helicase [Candidatus Saccharibacteria bacterium]|nr:ATP-dependent helicase [Candidatus Saccharibacteria bacterium]